MNVCLDSSCLVKADVAEPESPQVVAMLSEATEGASSRIAFAEVVAAIARVGRSGFLSIPSAENARDRFFRDEGSYLWLDFDRDLATRAGELAWRHGLRGFDAVHLATAVRWASWQTGDHTIFATFDKQLATAARAEGLNVWPEDDGTT